MNCPKCKSKNLVFNSAFSYENGVGAIYNCSDCGYCWDEDDRSMWESEENEE